MVHQSKFGPAQIVDQVSKFGAARLFEAEKPTIPLSPEDEAFRVARAEEIAVRPPEDTGLLANLQGRFERGVEAVSEPFEDFATKQQGLIKFFGLEDAPDERKQNLFTNLARGDISTAAKNVLQGGVEALGLVGGGIQSAINLIGQGIEEATGVPREESTEFINIGLLLAGGSGIPLKGPGPRQPRAARPQALLERSAEQPISLEPPRPIDLGAALEGAVIEPAQVRGPPTPRALPAPTVAERGRGAFERAQTTINEKIDNVFPPEKQIKSVLGDTLKLDKISTDNIFTRAQEFERVNGRRPTLLEIGGENIEGLARKVGGEIGEGRTIIENFRNTVLDSQTQAVREIADSTLNARLTGPTQSFFDDITALEVNMRKNAQPLYDRAFSETVTINENITNLTKTPAGKTALKNAEKLLLQEGRDPAALGIIKRGGKGKGRGELKLSDDVSVEALDAVKRGFDDIIEGSRDKTSGRLVLDSFGRATNSTLRSYISEVDTLSPVYREARAAWSGPSSLKNSMIDGRTAATKPSIKAQNITDRLKSMTANEQELYRAGFMRGLIDQVESGVAGSNRVRKLIRSEALEAKLSAVFENPELAKAFIGQLKQTEALAGRVQRVSPSVGSQTALRQADIASFNVMQGTRGFVGNIFRTGFNALRQNRNIRNEQIVNRDIADLLTQPLTDDIIKQVTDRLKGNR